jgi:hypothetical protein
VESLIVLAPAGAVLLVAMVATPPLIWLDNRIPLEPAAAWLFLATPACAPVTWVLLWALPSRDLADSGTCPSFDEGGVIPWAVGVLAFGSPVIGGVAVAAAIAVKRSWGVPIFWTVVAVVVAYAIWVPILFTAICGMN